MKENLILLTNHFPYGKGEEFLETEIKYLSSYFDKIFIIVNNPKDALTREVPDNTKVFPIMYRKNPIFNLISFKYLANRMFWNELKDIKKTYNLKFNYSILKRLISTMHFGNKIKEKSYELIKLNNLDIQKTVIYSYWWGTNAYAASILKKENKNIIAIARAHRGDLYLEKNSLNYLPMKKFMINNLDKLFLISSHGVNYLKEKYKFINSKKIEVSRLGINNKYNCSKKSNDDEFRLVSCSYVSKVKRINLIIEALANIKKTKIKWVHIGDGKEFEEIKNYASKLLKDKENIIFKFQGYMNNEKIYEFYQNNKIDFFINVSSSEGIPVSMMEVLSFSIPIIATDVGGVSEIVNNRNGFLLPSNPSVKSISEAIETMSSLSIDEVNKKRKFAYKTWSQKYNAEKNYSDFINRIDKL